MNYIISIVLSVVSGSLVFVVQKLLTENEKLRESKTDKQQALSNGVKSLLKIQLIEYHDKYMTDGNIPTYVYDNFEEMYHSYKALGGNGMITKMKEDIDRLRLGGNKND